MLHIQLYTFVRSLNSDNGAKLFGSWVSGTPICNNFVELLSCAVADELLRRLNCLVGRQYTNNFLQYKIHWLRAWTYLYAKLFEDSLFNCKKKQVLF